MAGKVVIGCEKGGNHWPGVLYFLFSYVLFQGFGCVRMRSDTNIEEVFEK